MNFSVTKYGKELHPKLYSWDEETKTFTSKEHSLVLDFHGCNGVTFKGGCNNTFRTGAHCNFETGPECTFITGSQCTFVTGSQCTFDTLYSCTFKAGKDSVVIRRDVFEIIPLEWGSTIKLNDDEIKGFTCVEEKHIITIDGKEIELSKESFENLKRQLT
jgi:hypothetical protein